MGTHLAALTETIMFVSLISQGLTRFMFLFLFFPKELDFQKSQVQQAGDKFVSVVSQFITLASFSFSDVEDLLAEAKELVRSPMPLRSDLGSVSSPPPASRGGTTRAFPEHAPCVLTSQISPKRSHICDVERVSC